MAVGEDPPLDAGCLGEADHGQRPRDLAVDEAIDGPGEVLTRIVGGAHRDSGSVSRDTPSRTTECLSIGLATPNR